MKDKRKQLKLPEELLILIKMAARNNNRTMLGELYERFKE